MENNLDKLFKSKLEGQEPEFHPAAWDGMEALLEEEGMVPLPKKKSRRAGIILFFTLGLALLLSGIGLFTLNQGEVISEGSTSVQSNKIETHSQILHSREDVDAPERDQQKPSVEIQEKATSNSPLPKRALEYSGREDKSFSNSGIENKSLENSVNRRTLKQGLSTSVSSIANPSLEVMLLPSVSEKSSRNQTEINKDHASNDPGDSKQTQFKTLMEEDSKYNSGNSEKTESSYLDSKPDVARGSKLQPIGILMVNSLLPMHPSRLHSPEVLPVHIQKYTHSNTEFGLQMNARYWDGLGYSIGPYMKLAMGKGYSLSVSTQVDIQQFDAGPELRVYDKAYSFGSTLTERTFTMASQNSLRLPVSVAKSFGGFGVGIGLIYNHTLTTNGNIGQPGEGDVSVSIQNDQIKPSRLTFTSEGYFNLSRHLRVTAGLEYRPKVFEESNVVQFNDATLYPTIGLRYSLFKL